VLYGYLDRLQTC